MPIEAGRFGVDHPPREDRVCNKCDIGCLGDEYHFILTCTNPRLVELRDKYISPYYSIDPNMSKLVELFNNRGKKLFKLGIYVSEGLKIYC